MSKTAKYRIISFFLSSFIAGMLCAQTVKVACVGNSVTFGAGIENPAYWNLPEFKEALSFQPDIVIIHLGLNDTDPRNWPRYRDDFVRDYSRLIDTFRQTKPGTEVKICRMTPIFTGHKRFTSSTRDWYWQVQEAIETVAKVNNVELIDLHSPLHRLPNLFPDALHPTGEGAKIIAKTIYGAITGQYGGLALAPVFGNKMVLQRRKPITFWGRANGGTPVTIHFSKQKKTTTTDKAGNWQIEFPSLEAGGPYTAIIENEKNKIELKDILIGDLWLCSGQSNMEFRLSQAATAVEDIPAAHFSKIRLFNMQPVAYTHHVAWDEETLKKVDQQQYFRETEWQHCTPEAAKDFSAVAYHFGKKMHEETDVPVGLILNAVGGSPTEAWIDRLTMEHHPRLVNMYSDWKNNDYINPWCRERAAKNSELSGNPLQRHPYHPSYLYEAAVAGMTRLSISGVIWYQGESNEQNVELHEVLFPTLAESWRNAWDDDFPFYYVQLSSMAVGRETWGHFRDSQRRLLQVVPHSGMAVSSDLGDSTDVHPRRKKEVGERLARLALHHTDGMTDITPSGPLFRDFSVEGRSLRLSFDYDERLHTSDGKPLRSFELAEYPGLYYPATAEIHDNVIRVSSPVIRNPKYVRYGWNAFSDGNLVNGDELPASTFSSQYNKD